MTASKDDAPAAVQAAIHNVAGLGSSSIGGGLIQMGLPRFRGQVSGLHGGEFTGVDELLFVVDWAEVANR